ncbi:glutamate receptor ionotropic, kainate 3-like [Haemaphysalis longicornis]
MATRFLLLLGAAASLRVLAFPEVIKIGALLAGEDEELVESALRYAVDRVNTEPALLPNAKLSLQVERMPADAGTLQAYRKVCSLLEGGAVALLGPSGGGDQASSLAASLCNALRVPQLALDDGEHESDYTLELAPSPKVLASACGDLLDRLGWLFVAYLYEGDIALERLEVLERDRDMANRKVLTFDITADGVWDELAQSGFRNFIVDVQHSRIDDVLEQAHEAGLMTELHSYLLVTLDAHVVGSRAALRQRVAEARVYSFRLVELEDEDFTLLGRRLVRYHPDRTAGGREKQTQLALVHDAVHVLAAGLQNLSESDLQLNPVECDNATYLQDGPRLLGAIKGAVYEGFTGEVQFDEDGERDIDKLQVFEWRRGRSELVATWTPEQGLDFVSDPYDDDGVPGSEGVDDSIDENSLENRTIIVTTILSAPFVMLKEGAEKLEGNDRFEGFCVSMLERLAEILGFQYQLRVVEDGHFGTEPEPGKWNGMVGELLAGRADLALAPLTMTSRRSAVLDFTAPFMTLGIGLLKARENEALVHTFLSPFSAALWCALVATVLAAMLLLSLVGRLSPFEWRRVGDARLDTDYTLGNCFWMLFSSLTLQRVTLTPKATSTVVAMVSWWLFSLVVMVAYASVLGEFIVRYRDRPTIDSLDDLLRQKELHYGTLRQGSTHQFFEHSTFPQYMKLWQGIQGQGEQAFVKSYADGIERVLSGSYAMFMESPTLEYLESRYCELEQVGDIIGSSGYALALPKGSAYLSELSAAIIRLKSDGTLQMQRHYWWRERGALNCPREQPVYRPTPFTVRFGRLSLVFVFLLLGLVVTMIVMLVIFVRRHARKNLSAESMSAIWSTLVEELRAAMLCRKDKHGRDEPEDEAKEEPGAAVTPATTRPAVDGQP